MKSKTKTIVTSAMLAALVCVATIIIKIPSPLKGYINLGDCVVLLTGWVLSPVYGVFAAGIGSALADIILGYVTYAPATFIIKGLMALTAELLSRKSKRISSLLFSALAAETVMVFGYYVFEGFLYGFGPSLVNMPANIVQGAAGILFGVLLFNLIKKIR